MLSLEGRGARVDIDPEAGGRIAQLTIDGLDLLVGRQDAPDQWGCFPMAPFAGRIRRGRFTWRGEEHALPLNLPPHAIHGTTFDRPWEVVAADEGTATLRIDLVDPWPFGGEVVQEVRLRNHSLHLRMEVRCGDEPMPATCGWHPWFRRELGRGGPLELDFEAGAMYLKDDEGIPTGAVGPPSDGPWDDCFNDMVRPPELRWPDALELAVDSHCPEWVIYTEPAHAICVEPQTGPPNALNLEPGIASPDDPVVATATLSWRK